MSWWERKKAKEPQKRQEPPKKGAATAHVATALYRRLSVTPGNLFFSPYSISTALAMLQAGAGGVTRQEIEAALGYSGTSEATIEAFGALAKQLASRSRPAPLPFDLSVANAIWCQAGYQVNPGFVEALRNQLGTEVKEADFEKAPDAAVRKVNAWVVDATHGRIREIVTAPDIHELTRVLLANAVYFKAHWLEPFDEESTKAEPFHLLDRRRVDVPMMHKTAYYSYGKDRNVQTLQVPYGNDWVVMLVLLPMEGKLEALERELGRSHLEGLIQKMDVVEVNLSLPTFRIESSFSLRSPLTKLGMATAFDQRADFGGISAEPGFAVSDVLHRAVVDVDEWGTEAAAVTTEVMEGSACGLRPMPVDFRVDRPFLFLILDKPTGTVLFFGRVVDPRP